MGGLVRILFKTAGDRSDAKYRSLVAAANAWSSSSPRY